jgi:methyl-accepting chemotaxis protein
LALLQCKLCQGAYAGLMSEPVRELPELDPEDALHGVVNQLTIHGRRMPVIIPGSVIEALGDFAGLLIAARDSGDLPRLMRQAMPWTEPLSDGELDQFASAIADASASDDRAPERLAAVLREWRETAEVLSDPHALEEIEAARADIASGSGVRGGEALAALRPRR